MSYDPNDGGVDFILKNIITNERIPIEVTSALKGQDVKNVRKAMDRYNSKFGIVIALNCALEVRDDVLILPLELFAFL